MPLQSEVDLARHPADLLALVTRLVGYRKLVKECPHIDGWRSWELIAPHWQCMSCGLVVRTEEREQLERWPASAVEPESEALGSALADWERP